jgi:hypothetical protein
MVTPTTYNKLFPAGRVPVVVNELLVAVPEVPSEITEPTLVG